MNKNIYEEAIQKNTVAFAYHEGVFDDRGKITDYIFIDMNPVFERYTGLKKEDIIGKNLRMRSLWTKSMQENGYKDMQRSLLNKRKIVLKNIQKNTEEILI